MLSRDKILGVFRTKGTPEITYVKREGGKYELLVSDALDEHGTICLIMGPSKTGKTTLYTRVITSKNKRFLRIICHSGDTAGHIWATALEYLEFERKHGKSMVRGKTGKGGASLKGKLGIPFVTNIEGGVSLGASRKRDETVQSERVLAEPSVHHLAGELKNSVYVLVLDGLHRLAPKERASVVECLRDFVEAEVSIVVVAATHDIDELMIHKGELAGRFSLIHLKGWAEKDLRCIVQLGFDHLKVPFPRKSIVGRITRESLGLPLITQALCLELLRQKLPAEESQLIFSKKDLDTALNKIALERFGNFTQVYTRLVHGEELKPGDRRALKFILTACGSDPIPINFTLTREELDERIFRINVQPAPRQSILNRTLSSLDEIQGSIGCHFLKRSKTADTLQILEPSFLFYLRWQHGRNEPARPDQIVLALLDRRKPKI